MEMLFFAREKKRRRQQKEQKNDYALPQIWKKWEKEQILIMKKKRLSRERRAKFTRTQLMHTGGSDSAPMSCCTARERLIVRYAFLQKVAILPISSATQ